MEKTPLAGPFVDQNIIITLPKSLTDPYRIKWLSVWCEDIDASCADLVLDSIDPNVNACVHEFRIISAKTEKSSE